MIRDQRSNKRIKIIDTRAANGQSKSVAKKIEAFKQKKAILLDSFFFYNEVI
jgi:hypothetical protein